MKSKENDRFHLFYAKVVLKFAKLNTVAQQREAVTRGRSLLPYRLRYNGGDVSPKHRVGDSRLASEFGRKSDNKPVDNTDCHPNTEALSANADQPFGERSPTS
ncbi:MAG: hypothetical protein LBL62_03200 [Planctomycetaceae bacterium]|nr:hypothetical protein [Planctomycetaceae bacterium]